MPEDSLPEFRLGESYRLDGLQPPSAAPAAPPEDAGAVLEGLAQQWRSRSGAGLGGSASGPAPAFQIEGFGPVLDHTQPGVARLHRWETGPPDPRVKSAPAFPSWAPPTDAASAEAFLRQSRKLQSALIQSVQFSARNGLATIDYRQRIADAADRWERDHQRAVQLAYGGAYGLMAREAADSRAEIARKRQAELARPQPNAAALRKLDRDDQDAQRRQAAGTLIQGFLRQNGLQVDAINPNTGQFKDSRRQAQFDQWVRQNQSPESPLAKAISLFFPFTVAEMGRQLQDVERRAAQQDLPQFLVDDAIRQIRERGGPLRGFRPAQDAEVLRRAIRESGGYRAYFQPGSEGFFGIGGTVRGDANAQNLTPGAMAISEQIRKTLQGNTPQARDRSAAERLIQRYYEGIRGPSIQQDFAGQGSGGGLPVTALGVAARAVRNDPGFRNDLARAGAGVRRWVDVILREDQADAATADPFSGVRALGSVGGDLVLNYVAGSVAKKALERATSIMAGKRLAPAVARVLQEAPPAGGFRAALADRAVRGVQGLVGGGVGAGIYGLGGQAAQEIGGFGPGVEAATRGDLGPALGAAGRIGAAGLQGAAAGGLAFGVSSAVLGPGLSALPEAFGTAASRLSQVAGTAAEAQYGAAGYAAGVLAESALAAGAGFGLTGAGMEAVEQLRRGEKLDSRKIVDAGAHEGLVGAIVGTGHAITRAAPQLTQAVSEAVRLSVGDARRAGAVTWEAGTYDPATSGTPENPAITIEIDPKAKSAGDRFVSRVRMSREPSEGQPGADYSREFRAPSRDEAVRRARDYAASEQKRRGVTPVKPPEGSTVEHVNLGDEVVGEILTSQHEGRPAFQARVMDGGREVSVTDIPWPKGVSEAAARSSARRILLREAHGLGYLKPNFDFRSAVTGVPSETLTEYIASLIRDRFRDFQKAAADEFAAREGGGAGGAGTPPSSPGEASPSGGTSPDPAVGERGLVVPARPSAAAPGEPAAPATSRPSVRVSTAPVATAPVAAPTPAPPTGVAPGVATPPVPPSPPVNPALPAPAGVTPSAPAVQGGAALPSPPVIPALPQGELTAAAADTGQSALPAPPERPALPAGSPVVADRPEAGVGRPGAATPGIPSPQTPAAEPTLPAKAVEPQPNPEPRPVSEMTEQAKASEPAGAVEPKAETPTKTPKAKARTASEIERAAGGKLGGLLDDEPVESAAPAVSSDSPPATTTPERPGSAETPQAQGRLRPVEGPSGVRPGQYDVDGVAYRADTVERFNYKKKRRERTTAPRLIPSEGGAPVRLLITPGGKGWYNVREVNSREQWGYNPETKAWSYGHAPSEHDAALNDEIAQAVERLARGEEGDGGADVVQRGSPGPDRGGPAGVGERVQSEAVEGTSSEASEKPQQSRERTSEDRPAEGDAVQPDLPGSAERRRPERSGDTGVSRGESLPERGVAAGRALRYTDEENAEDYSSAFEGLDLGGFRLDLADLPGGSSGQEAKAKEIIRAVLADPERSAALARALFGALERTQDGPNRFDDFNETVQAKLSLWMHLPESTRRRFYNSILDDFTEWTEAQQREKADAALEAAAPQTPPVSAAPEVAETRPEPAEAESAANEKTAAEPVKAEVAEDRDWERDFLPRQEFSIPESTGDRTKANRDALRLLADLEKRKVAPTDAERAILAGFTGWVGPHDLLTQMDFEVRSLAGVDRYEEAQRAVDGSDYNNLAYPGSAQMLLDLGSALASAGLNRAAGLRVHVGASRNMHVLTGLLRETGVMPVVSAFNDGMVGDRIARLVYPSMVVSEPEPDGMAYAALPTGLFDLVYSDLQVTNDGLDHGYDAPIRHDVQALLAAAAGVRRGGVLAVTGPIGWLDRVPTAQSEGFRSQFGLVAAVRGGGHEVMVFRRGHPGPDWSLQSRDRNSWDRSVYFVENPTHEMGRDASLRDVERLVQRVLGENLAEGQLQPADVRYDPDLRLANGYRDPEITAGQRQVLETNGRKALLEQLVNGDRVEVDDPTGELAWRLEGMLPLLDAVEGLRRLQLDPDATDAQVEAARTAAREMYDALVAGTFNEGQRGASTFLGLNHPASALAAGWDGRLRWLADQEEVVSEVETFTDRNGEMQRRTRKTYRAGGILAQRTNRPAVIPRTEPDPEKALGISLAVHGRIVLPYLMELTGLNESELARALDGKMFRDPENLDSGYVPYHEYLTGNLLQRYRAAKAAAKHDPSFQRQADLLHASLPEWVNAERITLSPGATWAPPEVFSDFVDSVLIEGVRDARNAPIKSEVVYNHAAGIWSVRVSDDYHNSEQAKRMNRLYGQTYTPDGGGRADSVDAVTQLQLALNLMTPRLGPASNPDLLSTQSAIRKQRDLVEALSEWAMKHPAWKDALVEAFNLKRNSDHVEPVPHDLFHTEAFPIPGMAREVNGKPFQPREHQVSAAYRAVSEGRLLLNHEVGTGKTFTMVIAAMEARRLRGVRNPTLISLNRNYNTVVAQARAAFPDARILSLRPHEMNPQSRMDILRMMRHGEWDLVILPISQVAEGSGGYVGAGAGIQVSPTMQLRWVESELAGFEGAFEQERQRQSVGKRGQRLQARRDDQVKGPVAKRIRAEIKALTERRDRLRAELELTIDQDQAREVRQPYWDELGIGMLLVDEIHEIRNLPVNTAVTGVKGLISSNKPEGENHQMRMRMDAVSRETPGGITIGATGTPIFNTIRDLWSMGMLVDPHGMQERGYHQFDTWLRDFTRIESDYQPDSDGAGYAVKSWIRFTNLRAIGQWLERFADTRLNTDEGMEAVRNKLPTLLQADEDGVHYDAASGYNIVQVPASQALLDWARRVGDFYEDWKNADPKAAIRRDNLGLSGVIQDAMSKAWTDLRMNDPHAPTEDHSMVDHLVRRVKRIYDEEEQNRGAQLIFVDKGLELKSAGSARRQLKAGEEVQWDPDSVRYILSYQYKQPVPPLHSYILDPESQRHPKGVVRARHKATDTMPALVEIEMDTGAGSESIILPESHVFRVGSERVKKVNPLFPPRTNFSLYAEVRDRLVAEGIPADEIQFINEVKTPSEKEALDAAMNSGQTRILIGSYAAMSTGLNIQERLKATHAFNLPHMPGQLAQAKGRMVRQGNRYADGADSAFGGGVLMYVYTRMGAANVPGYSAVQLQRLQGKQGQLTDLVRGRAELLEMTDVEENDPSFADLKAMSLGSPEATELYDLKNVISGKSGAVSDAQQIVAASQREVARAEGELSALRHRQRAAVEAHDVMGGFIKDQDLAFRGQKVRGALRTRGRDLERAEAKGKGADSIPSVAETAQAARSERPFAVLMVGGEHQPMGGGAAAGLDGYGPEHLEYYEDPRVVAAMLQETGKQLRQAAISDKKSQSKEVGLWGPARIVVSQEYVGTGNLPAPRVKITYLPVPYTQRAAEIQESTALRAERRTGRAKGAQRRTADDRYRLLHRQAEMFLSHSGGWDGAQQVVIGEFTAGAGSSLDQMVRQMQDAMTQGNLDRVLDAVLVRVDEAQQRLENWKRDGKAAQETLDRESAQLEQLRLREQELEERLAGAVKGAREQRRLVVDSAALPGRAPAVDGVQAPAPTRNADPRRLDAVPDDRTLEYTGDPDLLREVSEPAPETGAIDLSQFGPQGGPVTVTTPAAPAPTATAGGPAPAMSESSVSVKDARKVGPIQPRTLTAADHPPLDIKQAVHDLLDLGMLWTVPQLRNLDAYAAFLRIRAEMGRRARSEYQLEEALQSAFEAFMRYPAAFGEEFIDAIERGRVDTLPEEAREHARLIREAFDFAYSELEKLESLTGKPHLRTLVENYFGRLWRGRSAEDQAKIAQYNQQVGQDYLKPFEGAAGVGGRAGALEGRKSFRRLRTHEYYKDGREAGLVPISENPVEMALLKLSEVLKYVMGTRIVAELEKFKVPTPNGPVSVIVRSVAGREVPLDSDGERMVLLDGDGLRSWTHLYAPPHIMVSQVGDPQEAQLLQSLVDRLGIDLDRVQRPRNPVTGDRVAGYHQAEPGEAPKVVASSLGTVGEVIAHEVGHVLDDREQLGERLMGAPGAPRTPEQAQIRREMLDLAGRRELGLSERDAERMRGYFQSPRELVANLIHALVAQSDTVPARMPATHARLGELARDSEYLRDLLAFRSGLAISNSQTQIDLGGWRIIGSRYISRKALYLLRNLTSPGLESAGPGWTVLRRAINASVGLHLSFSLFHPAFIMRDVVISNWGLAFESLIRGQFGEAGEAALRSLKVFPAVRQTRAHGKGVRAAYRRYGADQDLAQIDDPQERQYAQVAQLLTRAGGRAGRSGVMSGEMVRANRLAFARLRETLRRTDLSRLAKSFHVTEAGLRTAVTYTLRVIETSSHIFFKDYIPEMKLGVFYRFMEMELEDMRRRGYDPSGLEMAQIAVRAWDHVEDSMGMVTTDNHLAPRWVKAAAYAVFNAPYWRGGALHGFGKMVLTMLSTMGDWSAALPAGTSAVFAAGSLASGNFVAAAGQGAVAAAGFAALRKNPRATGREAYGAALSAGTKRLQAALDALAHEQLRPDPRTSTSRLEGGRGEFGRIFSGPAGQAGRGKTPQPNAGSGGSGGAGGGAAGGGIPDTGSGDHPVFPGGGIPGGDPRGAEAPQATYALGKFLVGWLAVTAFNVVLGKALSGRWPWEDIDPTEELGNKARSVGNNIVFPRSGRIRPDGTEEHISMPGYDRDERIILGDFPHGVIEYLSGGHQPFLGAFEDTLRNRDFEGQQVYPVGTKFGEPAWTAGYARQVLKNSAPISFNQIGGTWERSRRNPVRMAREQPLGSFLGGVGISTVPSRHFQTEGVNALREWMRARRPEQGVTPERMERSRAATDVALAWKSGHLEDVSEAVQRAIEVGRVNPTERGVKDILLQSGKTRLERDWQIAMRSGDLTGLDDVYRHLSPAERDVVWGGVVKAYASAGERNAAGKVRSPKRLADLTEFLLKIRDLPRVHLDRPVGAQADR